ncbi:maltokinase N-terminal cap-like domain-containing protein [Streptomyces ficellus]|uniref:maltokinase N-terminal cap-like domain-containing protein n=1 Tax=Streptomyces ficellus TaxID=1977088 RepID=UPI00142E9BE7|nr:phosphotransferase [Streptomyces ficellus]
MTVSTDVTETGRIAADLHRLLPGWLARQRWFGGKDRAAPDVEPVLVETLCADGPRLLLVVVRTEHDEWYQLLVGERPDVPVDLADAVIGPSGPSLLYEATGDPELMGRLLALIAAGEPSGPVEFHRVPGAEIPAGLSAAVLTAEQSNTSIAFGGRMMLKVLRHVVPGPNAEVEMLTALRRAGGVPSAAPLGWVGTSASAPGGGITLGILQEFVPNRGDGWAAAVEEARACVVGECESVAPLGGFAKEAHGLGRAAARVHAALAGQLETRELGPAEVDELVAVLTGRLEAAVDQVPALLPFARQLRAVHQDLGEVAKRGHAPLLVQRIHGDLHLGQTLRGEDGWVVIDFEGEPGQPEEERRRLQPALRDIASMLRSFDYAAHHALAAVLGVPPGDQSPQNLHGTRLARRASAWAVHNRRAFCDGYTAAGGTDPRSQPVLLRAFEADKAVYEAVYEAHNRPEWLSIPMAAVRRLAGRQRSAG